MRDTNRELDLRALESAKANMGGVAWPTVALAFTALLAFILIIAVTLSGGMPTWLAVLLLTYLVYTLYTPLHEAVHRNISGQRPGWTWLDPLVGNLVSIPMGFSYTMHRATHFAHHSKTNDPSLDPDHVFGNGRPLDALLGTLRIVPAGYVWYFREIWPKATRREKTLFLVETGVILGVRIVPALAGFPMEVLVLGIIPNLLGVMVTAIAFAWVVHHPHEAQARYQTTSTFVLNNAFNWPITVLWLWQNYHSIHHLFPRVPFYRYHRVFDHIEDIMVARGAPIHRIGSRTTRHPLTAIGDCDAHPIEDNS